MFSRKRSYSRREIESNIITARLASPQLQVTTLVHICTRYTKIVIGTSEPVAAETLCRVALVGYNEYLIALRKGTQV